MAMERVYADAARTCRTASAVRFYDCRTFHTGGNLAAIWRRPDQLPGGRTAPLGDRLGLGLRLGLWCGLGLGLRLHADGGVDDAATAHDPLSMGDQVGVDGLCAL